MALSVSQAYFRCLRDRYDPGRTRCVQPWMAVEQHEDDGSALRPEDIDHEVDVRRYIQTIEFQKTQSVREFTPLPEPEAQAEIEAAQEFVRQRRSKARR